MRGKYLGFLPIIPMLAGVLLVCWYLLQPVTVYADGSPRTVRSFGLSVDSIIKSGGVAIYAGDSSTPPLNSIFWKGNTISIKGASSIAVWIDGQRISVFSTERYPANLLTKLGVKLFPGDTLTVDGLQSGSDAPFSQARYHTIQYRSQASVLAMFPVQSLPLTNTIGIALAHEDRALMGLDYSSPAEENSPSSQPIQIQRVDDQILLEQKVLPFQRKTIVNDQVELDQQTVTQSGEYGLAVELTRIRNVNGVESSRITLNSTVIRPAVDEILSLGTKVSVKQMAVGGTTIEYWRAVSMYATSYSPCNSGVDRCLYGTAGGEKVGKGIVAVLSRWFPYMHGQRVYIPGYGFATIEDTGGGIPGTRWIDLGYSDADYVEWHSWVTVYFLTPVPPTILYELN